MTTIETIRQEIERRKVQYYEREMKAWDDNGEYGDEDCYFYQGKRKACEGLLSFLDTLSEEPDKSLEEEVKNYFQGYWPGTETVEQCNTDLHFTPQAIIRLARHFAKWQKEQMLKDAVEGYVNYYEDGGGILMAEAQVGCPYHNGDKVRIIIVKAEEK